MMMMMMMKESSNDNHNSIDDDDDDDDDKTVHVRQQQHHLSSPPIRINKVFRATHSRRQADALLASHAGRVTVNGQPVPPQGQYVRPYHDIVCLDGVPITGWEALNGIDPPSSLPPTAKDTHNAQQQQSQQQSQQNNNTNNVFCYIKYWKPRGITCTTDRRVAENIIDALHGGIPGQYAGVPTHHGRLFPVGRLDKDTSGCILLTNDGRLPNALLRATHKQPKIYNVRVDRPVTAAHVAQLRVRTGINMRL